MGSGNSLPSDKPATCVISTDKGRLDIDYIHAWLSERSYWAHGRSRAKVESRSSTRSVLVSMAAGARSRLRA